MGSRGSSGKKFGSETGILRKPASQSSLHSLTFGLSSKGSGLWNSDGQRGRLASLEGGWVRLLMIQDGESHHAEAGEEEPQSLGKGV